MSFENASMPTDFSGASRLKIGIAAASYNQQRVDLLLTLVRNRLKDLGLPEDHVRVVRVPGSMEIPFTLSELQRSFSCDALVGLGLVIAGDTRHHDVIGDTTALTLQQLSIDRGVPVINGILVVENEEQADARLGAKVDRGAEFATAAVQMALLSIQLRSEREEMLNQ